MPGVKWPSGVLQQQQTQHNLPYHLCTVDKVTLTNPSSPFSYSLTLFSNYPSVAFVRFSYFPGQIVITTISSELSPHLIFLPTLPSPLLVPSLPYSSGFLIGFLSTLSLPAILSFSISFHILISPAPHLTTLYQRRIPTSLLLPSRHSTGSK